MRLNITIVNLPLFIARRIYGDKGDRKKVSRPAIRIATIGVAIGLAVMIITVSVVLGFKHTIRDKVVGFGCHIQIENLMSLTSANSIPICMGDSMIQVLSNTRGVSHVQRYAMAQGILKTDNDFWGVTLKGIGPEYDTHFLKECLVEGELPAFSDTASHYPLLISKTIAQKLRLNVGDRVFAYFIDDENVRTRRFNVVGIYSTNMKRFDDMVCITDIYATRRLNGWTGDESSGAELLVDDFNQLQETHLEVISQVGRSLDDEGNTYASQTILDAYPQLFSWLELLDLNVWIILALMVAVAGFTMISGLLIIILERTQMIGILKALGARNTTIRRTFLWFAAFIITRGLFWGNLLGIGIVMLQKYTGIVKLDPQTYYVSEAPMELNLILVVLLNLATLIICIFVLIAPSYLVSHIHPARSMRYE